MAKSRNKSALLLLSALLLGTLLIHGGIATAAECSNQYSSADARTAFIIRWGQGGFRDSRSPDGDVGGGQFALDIIPCDWPFAFTLSSEYYTRSPDPTENFEISKLYALSLLYDAPLQKFEKTDYFLAAGIGRLKVPDSGTRVDGDLVNLEVGLHWKRFDRFGFYGSLKYLYAQESTGGRKIIDFSETIFMLGVTYRFAL